jgi:hypothetical protein
MTPEERELLRAVQKQQALEAELQTRAAQEQIDRLNEKMHPTASYRLKQFYNEMHNIKVKLPKVTMG